MTNSLLTIKNFKRVSAGFVLAGSVSAGIGGHDHLTTNYTLPSAERAVLDNLAERNSALDTKLQSLPRGIYPNTNLDDRLGEIATKSEEISQDALAFQKFYNSKEVQDAMVMRDELYSQEMPYKAALGGGCMIVAFGSLAYFFLGKYEEMDAQRRKELEERHGIPPN